MGHSGPAPAQSYAGGEVPYDCDVVAKAPGIAGQQERLPQWWSEQVPGPVGAASSLPVVGGGWWPG